jgi:hypothetical protein
MRAISPRSAPVNANEPLVDVDDAAVTGDPEASAAVMPELGLVQPV